VSAWHARSCCRRRTRPMFDTDVERTVLVAVVTLCLALSWYLKTKLESVLRKLDRILAAFEGLRKYLYEIDPQFDDERHLLEHLASKTALDAGASPLELMEKNKSHSRRTLNTSFNDD
jgi:hypothetical protein